MGARPRQLQDLALHLASETLRTQGLIRKTVFSLRIGSKGFLQVLEEPQGQTEIGSSRKPPYLQGGETGSPSQRPREPQGDEAPAESRRENHPDSPLLLPASRTQSSARASWAQPSRCPADLGSEEICQGQLSGQTEQSGVTEGTHCLLG